MATRQRKLELECLEMRNAPAVISVANAGVTLQLDFNPQAHTGTFIQDVQHVPPPTGNPAHPDFNGPFFSHPPQSR